MRKRMVLLALFVFVAFQSFACHINFQAQGNPKSCKANETLIITVKLTLTHRTCKVAAQETKFKYDGVQIVGATPWKEESAGVFVRQIKAKVLNDKKGKILLSASRTCDKEGGYGTFTLPKD